MPLYARLLLTLFLAFVGYRVVMRIVMNRRIDRLVAEAQALLQRMDEIRAENNMTRTEIRDLHADIAGKRKRLEELQQSSKKDTKP
jgi:cell division protein FtsB